VKVIQPLNKIDTIKPPKSKAPKEAIVDDVKIHEDFLAKTENKEKKVKKSGFFKKAEKLEVKEEDKEVKIKKARGKVFVAITVSAIVFFVLAATVVGLAYAEERAYSGKAFIGVKVWDENVEGKTTEQIEALLGEKVESYQLLLKGPDQEYKASAQDLGLAVDKVGIAEAAVKKGRDKYK
jgi:hypothetical protein